MNPVKVPSPVKVTLKERHSERVYEGDFAAVVTVTASADGSAAARVSFAPSSIQTGLGLFVGAVELLQALVASSAQGPHVEAAKAALQVIDDNDPAKTCPFCGRKPRKDSDKAVWTQDHVLVACERCVLKLDRDELAKAAQARA